MRLTLDGSRGRTMSSNEIHLSWLEYQKVLRNARRSRATNASSTSRFLMKERNSYPDGFEAYFCDHAAKFGEDIATKRRVFPSRLSEALQSLTEKSDEQPFIVVRNVIPSTKFPLSYSATVVPKENGQLGFEKRARSLAKGYSDIVISGLIAATGCSHRTRLEGRDICRDRYSTPNSPTDLFSPEHDFPTRFRQTAPELGFYSDDSVLEQSKLTARVVVIACIENPIRDPVNVLSVSTIMRGMQEQDKKALRSPNSPIFDYVNASGAEGGRVQRLLMEGPNGESWLSYDPNRLDFQSMQDWKARKAVHALGTAINQKASEAQQVVLRRGDALILDNYRMLTMRKERPYTFLSMPLFGRPPIRWLRVGHGYPDQAWDGYQTEKRTALEQKELQQS